MPFILEGLSNCSQSAIARGRSKDGNKFRTFVVILLNIKDIFRVENNLYSPCPILEGIETRTIK